MVNGSPGGWGKITDSQRVVLDHWYEKICEAGHGRITVTIHRKSGSIEVRPEISIVCEEEHQVVKDA